MKNKSAVRIGDLVTGNKQLGQEWGEPLRWLVGAKCKVTDVCVRGVRDVHMKILTGRHKGFNSSSSQRMIAECHWDYWGPVTYTVNKLGNFPRKRRAHHVR